MALNSDLKHELQTVLNTVLGPNATKDEVRSFVRSALAGSEFQAGQETQPALILRSVLEKIKREAIVPSPEDGCIAEKQWPGSTEHPSSLPHQHSPALSSAATQPCGRIEDESPSLSSAATQLCGRIEDGEGDDELNDDWIVLGDLDLDGDIDGEDMHRADDIPRSWHSRSVDAYFDDEDMHHADDAARWNVRSVDAYFSPIPAHRPQTGNIDDSDHDDSDHDEDRSSVHMHLSSAPRLPPVYLRPHSPTNDYSETEMHSGLASPVPREIHVSPRRVIDRSIEVTSRCRSVSTSAHTYRAHALMRARTCSHMHSPA